MSGEKKHQPSKKKLKNIRKEGNCLKAPLLGQTISLTTCILTIYSLSPAILVKSKILLQYLSREILNNPQTALGVALEYVFSLTLCFVLPCVAMGHVMEALQVGFKLEPAILSPKFERLNPATAILSLLRTLAGSWSYLLRALLALMFLFILILFLFFRLPAFFMDVFTPQLGMGLHIAQVLLPIGVVILALFAALEYGLKRREFLNTHGMNDEELRREIKEDEGDPWLKSFRRMQHEALVFEQLVKRVRSAKCIIVEKV